MPSPKRTVFKLNLDSESESVYQRVERPDDEGSHDSHGTNRVQTNETRGPSTTHSDLTFVTRPFEKLVNRAVAGVVEGSGKKIATQEGEIAYSTRERRTTKGDRNTEERDHGAGSLNIVSKTKRRAIEDKYDTSEL